MPEAFALCVALRGQVKYFNDATILKYLRVPDSMPPMPRPFSHPSVRSITLDGILHGLSDPIRRQIVARLLCCDGMSCSKACDDLPPSTVSFHHKVLRDAGLIRSEKRGVEVVNVVRKAELEARFPGLIDAILRYHKPANRKE